MACTPAGGLAVMTGDVSALEATVEHGGIARRGLRDGQHGLGQCRIAARAVGGAQVEVGQPAFEEAGNDRADRVRIPQHRHAMQRTDARQLAVQLRVVGLPDGLAARGDLGVVRCLARPGTAACRRRHPWGTGPWCSGRGRGWRCRAGGSGPPRSGNGWPAGWTRPARRRSRTAGRGASRCRAPRAPAASGAMQCLAAGRCRRGAWRSSSGCVPW